MASIPFAASQVFAPGTTPIPAGGPATIPAGVNGVTFTVTSSPMLDPTTKVTIVVLIGGVERCRMIAFGGPGRSGTGTVFNQSCTIGDTTAPIGGQTAQMTVTVEGGSSVTLSVVGNTF